MAAAKYHVRAHDLTPDRSTDYGPYRVRLVHDSDAENPWEAWDCMTPLIAYSCGQWTFDHYESGEDIESFFDFVSDAWISRHWRKLAEALQLDPGSHDTAAREYAASAGCGLAAARRDEFTAALAEMKPEGRAWGRVVDYFDTLESLFGMAGIPALSTQRNGYCQGDCIRLFLVCTPAHAKRCGYNPRKHDERKEMESAASLYGAWAFGDCWGYVIEKETEEDGPREHVDSCFGYYGAYWEKDSGLHEAIESALNSASESAERERVQTLKTLIRNRVPLHMRADILAS